MRSSSLEQARLGTIPRTGKTYWGLLLGATQTPRVTPRKTRSGSSSHRVQYGVGRLLLGLVRRKAASSYTI
ncbi:hypothetical protein PAXRUDRAFT_836478 [Paxillus rubicundulus Ve08.2h10]|uniref:Uncharacterized protein n=1 Tax=Paxillus rubicundulus Ve08.2h10 TaxID=930991 RepID=A0A0D0BL00_9AGAM|nr:hypothetical protein PAXRUDRAFT_836478 [Paxillus rubicundulus Ve08.2h10]